jgi:hypothetical protein
MKKFFGIALIAIFALLSTLSVHSQEWTKDQLEVWKTVENEWNLWKSGDVNGMAAILHEKYQGWNVEDPLPVNKATVIEHFTMMKDAFKVTGFWINPARITVADNSAVVNYYFTFSYSTGDGDKMTIVEHKGKSVEFYTKTGGKWLLLGDMMAFQDDEEDDD